MNDLLTIAIIGKPNVGKSTLFNKLCGGKLAITDNMPGITRDRREWSGCLHDIDFKIVDTAGLDDEIMSGNNTIFKQIFYQIKLAIKNADLVIFVADTGGIDANDIKFAEFIRKNYGGKKIIPVINKIDKVRDFAVTEEYYKLGYDNYIGISAEHKVGFGDLYDELLPYKKIVDTESRIDKIRIAIVGRPNAGKSTFLNAILREDRVLVSAEAGTTRDPVHVDFEFEGKVLQIIDTAGLRKKAKIIDKIEILSVDESLRNIRLADIVILLIDVNFVIDKQDLDIASLVLNDGRGLAIGLNKSDTIKDSVYLGDLVKKLRNFIPSAKDLPIEVISAVSSYGIKKLLRQALALHENLTKKIPTRELNLWLNSAMQEHYPGLTNSGKKIKLKYVTQTGVKPPEFVVFSNYPSEIRESYRRYISNSLQKHFKFSNVPIRVKYRKSANPFDKN